MVCFATVFAAKYFLIHTLHLLAEVPTWLSLSVSLPSSHITKEQRRHRGCIIIDKKISSQYNIWQSNPLSDDLRDGLKSPIFLLVQEKKE